MTRDSFGAVCLAAARPFNLVGDEEDILEGVIQVESR